MAMGPGKYDAELSAALGKIRARVPSIAGGMLVIVGDHGTKDGGFASAQLSGEALPYMAGFLRQITEQIEADLGLDDREPSDAIVTQLRQWVKSVKAQPVERLLAGIQERMSKLLEAKDPDDRGATALVLAGEALAIFEHEHRRARKEGSS